MVDGDEGFTKALISTTHGNLQHLEVMGPIPAFITSHFGFHRGAATKTAVVEMAAAAGLSLVPRHQRNPLYTTTFGVGQLLKAALEAGAEHILLGCGDSRTCRGGIGMARALGARFFHSKSEANPQAQGGALVSDWITVHATGLCTRLKDIEIDVACNWHNVLCGDKSVARVFGPQKGTTPAEVELLSSAMDGVASVTSRYLGRDTSLQPGSDASDGMGAGLLLIRGTLHPRHDIITKFLNITSLVASSDLVITAEGGIDEQTPRGKIPSEVAQSAKLQDIPVFALAGNSGVGGEKNYEAGIDACASTLQGSRDTENCDCSGSDATDRCC